MWKSKANKSYVYKITIVAAVGGLLFGYDTAVVAGAIGFIQKRFDLSAAMMGWIASCALIGCIVGAMFSGYLSDKFGRKKMLILSAILFAVSSVGTSVPHDLTIVCGLQNNRWIGNWHCIHDFTHVHHRMCSCRYSWPSGFN